MNRTTICLDRPILDRVRDRAHKAHKTLKEVMTELLLLGLAKTEKSFVKKPAISFLNLGKEQGDISSRARLYDNWENDK